MHFGVCRDQRADFVHPSSVSEEVDTTFPKMLAFPTLQILKIKVTRKLAFLKGRWRQGGVIITSLTEKASCTCNLFVDHVIFQVQESRKLRLPIINSLKGVFHHVRLAWKW